MCLSMDVTHGGEVLFMKVGYQIIVYGHVTEHRYVYKNGKIIIIDWEL